MGTSVVVRDPPIDSHSKQEFHRVGPIVKDGIM